MKKIILICSIFSITLNAQIVNIENKNGTRTNGYYYKDVNNHLNQFVGTYKYENGNEKITMIFKKIINHYNGEYYQDLLVGEVKYEKNGIVLFDNLSRINQNLPNPYSHDICGNSIIENLTRPVCEGCTTNQKRARLIFFGRDNNDGGTIILQKIIITGQPDKLKIWLHYDNRIILEGEPTPPDALIRSGYYTLIKQ
jgi:hypothetical protein